MLIVLSIIYIPNIYNFIVNASENDIGLNSIGNLINDNELDSLEDSGITGENYTFDEVYNIYYSYLDSDEKTIYKQIYANIIETETKFIPVVEITTNEVIDIVESVYNDHPELFWLNTSFSYKYTSDGICAQIILDYNETVNNLDYYQEIFNNSADEIIQEAEKLNTDYEKEKYVHDTLIEMITYDENADMSQSAYSALVNHKTVCSGYSRAFQYILNQLEITTYYITGYAQGSNHAWNIVKLDNEYYNVDLTWDDQTTIIYNYFNVTDSLFNKTHSRSTLSSKLPSCNGTTYTYSNNNSTNNSINNNNNNDTNNNNSSNNEDSNEIKKDNDTMKDEEIENNRDDIKENIFDNNHPK